MESYLPGIRIVALVTPCISSVDVIRLEMDSAAIAESKEKLTDFMYSPWPPVQGAMSIYNSRSFCSKEFFFSTGINKNKGDCQHCRIINFTKILSVVQQIMVSEINFTLFIFRFFYNLPYLYLDFSTIYPIYI